MIHCLRVCTCTPRIAWEKGNATIGRSFSGWVGVTSHVRSSPQAKNEPGDVKVSTAHLCCGRADVSQLESIEVEHFFVVGNVPLDHEHCGNNLLVLGWWDIICRPFILLLEVLRRYPVIAGRNPGS